MHALESAAAAAAAAALIVQAFLELVQGNPYWLQMFLVEYPYDTRPTPRTWASDMLCWAVRAASKRCAHQLQAYVSACLRQLQILGAEAAGGSQNQTAQQQQQQQHQVERGLRQQLLPPLCLALVGVVEQLVMQLRGCLPRTTGTGLCPPIEIPSELAAALLAYAESSPWAAAHLLQVCGCGRAWQAPGAVGLQGAAQQRWHPVAALGIFLLCYTVTWVSNNQTVNGFAASLCACTPPCPWGNCSMACGN